MSEIESVAWIDPEDLPSLRHKWTMAILKLEKDDSETMPLYTAEGLAEAVAAERERCAKVCEALAPSMGHGTWVESACKNCAEAIRSAAK